MGILKITLKIIETIMEINDIIYVIVREREQNEKYPKLDIHHCHIEKCIIADIREMFGKMYSYSDEGKFFEIGYVNEEGVKRFFKTTGLNYKIVDGTYFINEDEANEELERRMDDEKRYRKEALKFFRKSLIFDK